MPAQRKGRRGCMLIGCKAVVFGVFGQWEIPILYSHWPGFVHLLNSLSFWLRG